MELWVIMRLKLTALERAGPRARKLKEGAGGGHRLVKSMNYRPYNQVTPIRVCVSQVDNIKKDWRTNYVSVCRTHLASLVPPEAVASFCGSNCYYRWGVWHAVTHWRNKDRPWSEWTPLGCTDWRAVVGCRRGHRRGLAANGGGSWRRRRTMIKCYYRSSSITDKIYIG